MGTTFAVAIIASVNSPIEAAPPPLPTKHVNPPLSAKLWQPYFPDLSKPLFLTKGMLVCGEEVALEVALQTFETDLKIDWHAPMCMPMAHSERVTILDYSLGAMSKAVMVHATIHDPQDGTLRLWTLLQWLDDRVDCQPDLPGCD